MKALTLNENHDSLRTLQPCPNPNRQKDGRSFRFRPQLFRSNFLRETSTLVGFNDIPKAGLWFVRQTEDNNCPSGKTNQRLWSGTLNSRAMRLWMFQPGSLRWRAFKRITSSPAKPQQVSSIVYLYKHNLVATQDITRSSTEWQICNVPSPRKGCLVRDPPFHKLQHGRHFWEALCDPGLQTPG